MNNIEILENPSKEELKIASLLLGFDVVNDKPFKNGFVGNALVTYGIYTGDLRYSPIYSDVQVLRSDYRFVDDCVLMNRFFSNSNNYINSVVTEDRVFMEKLMVIMIKCGFTPEQAFYVLCRDSSEFLTRDKKVKEKKASDLENQFIYKLNDYLLYLKVGWGRGKVEEIQEEFIKEMLSVDKDKYDLAIALLGKEGDGFFKYIKKRKPRVVSEKRDTSNRSGLEKKIAPSKRTKKSTAKTTNKPELNPSSIFASINDSVD